MIEMTTQRIESATRAAACAAAWWASRLRDAIGVGDNGGQEIENVMAGFMTRRIRDNNPPTEDNCARFERALRESIVDVLRTQQTDLNHYYDRAGFDDGGVDICLDVDYHPCPLLFECLELAGVDKGVADMAALPLKTTMKVSARRVLVAHGYGAAWVEIYGPAWGSSHAEHQAAAAQRSEALNRIYDATPMGVRLFGIEWKGPVRP